MYITLSLLLLLKFTAIEGQSIPCRATSDDGFIYDLTPLSQFGPIAQPDETWEYTISICTNDIPCVGVDTNCVSSGYCQKQARNPSPGSTYCVGSLPSDSTAITPLSGGKGVVLHYRDGSTGRAGTVNITCNPSGLVLNKVVISPQKITDYQFSFESSAACGLPPSLKSFNKVTLSVPNIRLTQSWYTKKLGFVPVSTGFIPGGSFLLMGIPNTPIQIEFIQPDNPVVGFFFPDPPKHYLTFGITQFSFNVDDLVSFTTQLSNNDVPVLWCYSNTVTGQVSAYFKDLNEAIFQLIQSCPCVGPNCCPPLPSQCPPQRIVS